MVCFSKHSFLITSLHGWILQESHWKKLGIKEGMRVIHLHARRIIRSFLANWPQGAILEDKLRQNAAFIHTSQRKKK